MLEPVRASNIAEMEKGISTNATMATTRMVMDAVAIAEYNQDTAAQEEPLIPLINAIIRFPQGSQFSKQDK